MVRKEREKDWINIVFLTISPVIGIVGTAIYTFVNGFHLVELLVFGLFFYATGFSITAGYHRYFSHKSYACHPILRFFFLVFGACAIQNSVRKWAADHRLHHTSVDQELDPYDITKGAWYAHIVWIFYKHPPNRSFSNIPDLERDPMVAWQHRYYLPIGILVGFGIPVLIGSWIGRPLGGLLWGGFLRVVLVHHMTFFVNSLAHMWGKQPYSTKDTSRDFWAVALLTNGEGYHNFHHRFPVDYRNAIKWYQWDPTKWIIWCFQGIGLTSNLYATEPQLIVKATLDVEVAQVKMRFQSLSHERWAVMHTRLEVTRQKLEHAIAEWSLAKAKYRDFCNTASLHAEHLRIHWKNVCKECELQYRDAKAQWHQLIRNFHKVALSTSLPSS